MNYKQFHAELKKATTWQIYAYHDVVLNKELKIYMKKRVVLYKPHLKLDETVLIHAIDYKKVEDVMLRQAITTVQGLQALKFKIPPDLKNLDEKNIPLENKKYRKYEEFLESHKDELTINLDLLKEVFIGMHIQEVNQMSYTQALFRLGFKNAVEICGETDPNEEPANYTEDNGKGSLYF